MDEIPWKPFRHGDTTFPLELCPVAEFVVCRRGCSDQQKQTTRTRITTTGEHLGIYDFPKTPVELVIVRRRSGGDSRRASRGNIT